VPVKFQVEPWATALPELRPLFRMLWDDVAVDKDRFVAECDEDKYAACDSLGMLHLVTARSDKELVGYFLMLVQPNPHYKGQGLMSYTDMFYMKPEFRRGNAGLKLFSFMEETLKAKGVVKMYSSHKVHRDRSAMFKVLGWKPVDLVYSKVLEAEN
jgi:hypothetical protein